MFDSRREAEERDENYEKQERPLLLAPYSSHGSHSFPCLFFTRFFKVLEKLFGGFFQPLEQSAGRRNGGGFNEVEFFKLVDQGFQLLDVFEIHRLFALHRRDYHAKGSVLAFKHSEYCHSLRSLPRDNEASLASLGWKRGELLLRLGQDFFDALHFAFRKGRLFQRGDIFGNLFRMAGSN